MKPANYTRTLFYICLPEQLDKNAVLSLENQLDLKLPVIHPDQLMQATPQFPNKILVIDFAHHKLLLEEISRLPLVWKNFETIAINVPRRMTTEELLKFHYLKGVFYTQDSPENIRYGMLKVQEGVNWLPREVSGQLLQYYRSVVSVHTAPVNVDLTIRELQVLRCLQDGISNLQMAEALFVSECTIKSHLYQIFKKLSVKNRVQAIAWANQNLLG